MIQLTREYRFTADPAAGPALNSWAGGPAAGSAPFWRLRLTVAGEPDPRTGYLCDIKRVDDLLQERAVPVAVELLAEHGAALPPGRLLAAVWAHLHEPVPGARVVRLELLPTPFHSYTIEGGDPGMVLFSEQFEFSAAHRLHCPGLSDEENRRVFGKCNNPSGHGHNYVVEVTVAGAPEQVAGLSARLHLERVVKREVIDRFDHKHLNEDTEEFRRVNPTVENITRVVWGRLVDALKPARLHRVRVYETPKTWADYGGE